MGKKREKGKIKQNKNYKNKKNKKGEKKKKMWREESYSAFPTPFRVLVNMTCLSQVFYFFS